ncbi:YlxR family protein [Funiculus sociatus GB2-A5]|jgi:hypothetical protein|uniref:YlxR family protein n=1 Tax=Funiculus sociatus GB2-A5 TaxID=2933946 RepID=A0ABV0JV30_9CYAN|nr:MULTISPECIES: YlxR family protein [unclassified Trichocoleus]MBD1904295.1 YlxR family protein [Trichocoleus sp. FACHB-832]MBD1931022.1 YlxR family protein [Trichocoleus sp. FACHB-69]MBD2002698.1 YlxR family protein [Trichocoleus sp. FACHB-40]MBD2065213.1 YlxR family protein [Trichocoleus sp. FACHB-6]
MKPNYRRCVSCRQVALKSDFWRVVRLYPSGKLQLDQGMGRSAYICPQESCLVAARKKNKLGRSLKAPVSEELYQTLWQRLTASQHERSLLLVSETSSQEPPIVPGP